MKTSRALIILTAVLLTVAPIAGAVDGNFTNLYATGLTNLDSGTFYVDDTNNRVGVGLTNPSRTFHQRGTEDSGFVDFLVENNGTSGNTRFIVQNSVRQWIWTAVSSGAFSLYGTGGAGNAIVINASGKTLIKKGLDVTGDIYASGEASVSGLEIRSGSDLSEKFEIQADQEIKPGMVVSIHPEKPGQLVLSNKAYQRTVAGIVSGANGLKTGLIMGQQGSIADGRHAVALTGRVYCYVDASNGPVRPGDLLTTSSVAGHAMKVEDYAKAQGAIIGKAMSPLKSGKGLVLVLVSLQ